MNVLASSSPLAALAGQYVLRAGQVPSLVGSRPVLQAGTLARLLRGHPGVTVVRTLGTLFTLCAHAHQRTAALALNAACLQAAPLPVAPRAMLRLETVRDHLRSMALDWPYRLALDPQQARGLLALLHSPVMTTSTVSMTAEQIARCLDQLRVWLAGHDPLWTEGGSGAHQAFALEVLHNWETLARRLQPELISLDVLHPDAQEQTRRLSEVAQAMLDSPDFPQSPTWRGHCAETGAWTRLRDRQQNPLPNLSAWARLWARWSEVRVMACAAPLPHDALHDPLLSSGALALGAGVAIAWCEMARGLLMHWVQVDAQGRVVDYRVLAPTEWNFHPHGALAQALADLSPDDVRSARCLAAAFDACVDCRIDSHC